MDIPAVRRRISECTAALLQHQPFFGFLLQQMDQKLEPSLDAAFAVSYSPARGRIVLSFNPEHMVQPLSEPSAQDPWTEETPTEPWSDGNLAAALLHEALHLVLMHLSRIGKRDARLWNIAGDLVINQTIANLPRGLTTLESMSRVYGLELPRNLAADGYYRILEEKLGDCPVHGQGPGAAGCGAETPESGAEHKHGEGRQGGGKGRPCPYCTGQTLDAHGGCQGAGEDGREAARSAVEYAYRRQQEHERNGRGRGNLPGELVRLIEEALHRPVNWRRLLRRAGQSAIVWGRRATIRRPHRRYGDLMPGRKPTRAGKVVVCVDTSGSVGQKLLGAFWHEIQAMRRNVAVCIIECDARVHDAYLLTNRVPELKGGGGSSFVPVFDLLRGIGDWPRKWRSASSAAGSLIFLTDGDIAVPETNLTGLDVYWAVPRNKAPPTTSYGTVVPLEVDY